MTNLNLTAGTYRVSFTIGNDTFGRRLETRTTVKALSRAHAIAQTPGGTGAEVLVWGPCDPEPVEWDFEIQKG